MKYLLCLLVACLVLGGCAPRIDERIAHYKPTYSYYKMPDGHIQKVFTGPCWMDPDTTGP